MEFFFFQSPAIYINRHFSENTFNTATELLDFLRKPSNFNQDLDRLEHLCKRVKAFTDVDMKSFFILFKRSVKNHYRKCTQ